MFLDQQVTDLDTSKKLYELGINQESLFYWIRVPTSAPNVDGWGLTYLLNIFQPRSSFKELYSAFNASELLDLLPIHISSKEQEPFNSYRLYISGSVIVKNPECIDPKRTHIVNYLTDTYEAPHFLSKSLTKNIWDINAANALAKMLIFLHEQGLIGNAA